MGDVELPDRVGTTQTPYPFSPSKPAGTNERRSRVAGRGRCDPPPFFSPKSASAYYEQENTDHDPGAPLFPTIYEIRKNDGEKREGMKKLRDWEVCRYWHQVFKFALVFILSSWVPEHEMDMKTCR